LEEGEKVRDFEAVCIFAIFAAENKEDRRGGRVSHDGVSSL
jgi:hypothetical protein